MGPILLALALAALAWVLVVGDLVRRHRPAWHWYLVGYPVTVCRVLATWRKVTMLNDLAVSKRPPRGLLGDLMVKGDPLRPIVPRLSFPRATRLGLIVMVQLHAGQTPATYMKAADALVHAWKVHAVRVTFTPEGRFASYDAESPLTTSEGKRTVVEQLALRKRVLAVGDGATDLAMKPVVDLFAAFTGFVSRAAVVANADATVD